MGRIWYVNPSVTVTAKHYSAITNQQQRVEVYAVGADGNLYWAFQPGGAGPASFELSAFASLGAPPGGLIPNSQVGLGLDLLADEPGSVEVFGFTALEFALATISQTESGTESTGDWSAWGLLSSAPPADDAVPVVAQNADGRLEVFAFGGTIWHIWQNFTQPATWQNRWQPIMVQPAPNQYVTGGEPGQAISVALTNFPVRWLEAFAMQSPFAADGPWQGDAQVWCSWQCAAESVGGWRGPIFPSLGLPPLAGNIQPMFSTPSVAVNMDGRLEVFIGVSDGTLWHIFQTAPPGTNCTTPQSWSAWTPLGIPTERHIGDNLPCPAAALNPLTGFLEVYVVGDDGALWANTQIPAGPLFGWGTWQSFGSPVDFPLRLAQTPSLAVDFAKRIWVFLNGSDGSCVYTPNHL
jgi:hypothetical protein